MSHDWIATLIGKHIIKHAPKGATGIYITQQGVRYGFRTNPDKFPYNYVSFSSFHELRKVLEP